MATDRTTFRVKVNDTEHDLTVNTTLYHVAAAAVPAVLGIEFDEPLFVEIWSPHLLPEYGPYIYELRWGEYRRIVVGHAIRR